MESLARLVLFGFAYLTIFVISNFATSTYDMFHAYAFLLVSVLLMSWIYYLHFFEKTAPRNLKEILYIFTFVSCFTSLAGFLGSW